MKYSVFKFSKSNFVTIQLQKMSQNKKDKHSLAIQKNLQQPRSGNVKNKITLTSISLDLEQD